MKRINGWLSIFLVLSILPGCTTPRSGPGPYVPPAMLAEPPPPEAQSLWQRAEQDRMAGNISAAIATWENIARTYPNNSIAAKSFHALGNVYLDQGQGDRALQYFDYLLYTYPHWEDADLARVDRLRCLWRTGKKKQAEKEAFALWEASAQNPDAQVRLAHFMVNVYRESGDAENGFDWATAGFGKAQTEKQKVFLAQATLDLLRNLDAPKVQRLMQKNPSDFMKFFLDFRLAQIAVEREPSAATRERLDQLLNQNPAHPLVAAAQGALREMPSGMTLPLNADRIGCLVPLNGPYGKYGNMVLRGLTMAVEDWNRVHSDQPVTLVVRDTQADPDLAIRSFEDLTRNEGVLAIIGPLGSKPAKAVSPLANKWNVPLLTLTQKDEDTIVNPFVVNIFLDNRELVHTLVSYCRERLGYSRFAMLYPDDRYGQRLAKIFAEVVTELGGSLLASVSYEEGSTDFKVPIQKLAETARKNSPPSGVKTTPFEALFLPDEVQTVSLIAPQLPYYNIVGATLLGTNLWGEAPLAQTGGIYVDQALYASPFFPESQDSQVRAFRERYQTLYLTLPSYIEAQAYDALMLLLEARTMVPYASAERTSVLQNLLQIQHHAGLTGTSSFTPGGDLSRDYLVLQILNGQIVQVYP